MQAFFRGKNLQRRCCKGKKNETSTVKKEQKEQDPACFFRPVFGVESPCKEKSQKHGDKIEADVDPQGAESEAAFEQIIASQQEQGHEKLCYKKGRPKSVRLVTFSRQIKGGK